MDFLKFIESLGLDPIIIILVIAGGFWAKTYLDGWTHIRIGKWQPKFTQAWKTLIVGTILSAGYFVIVKLTGGFKQEMWLKFFYSYTFATSFYEIIIGRVTNWISEQFSKK